METVWTDIMRRVPEGTPIPKPQGGSSIVKGFCERRGEPALVYSINQKAAKPSNKAVTRSEWVQAFVQLRDTGALTRPWFKAAMPERAERDPCNFTTIGGVFVLLGYAVSSGRGAYRSVLNHHRVA